MFGLAKTNTPGWSLLLFIPAFLILSSCSLPDTPAKPAHTVAVPKDDNKRLQAIAESTLAAREGAIVVLDPQTGCIQAIVNRELAFESAFPPGSTIKPFTAITTLLADFGFGQPTGIENQNESAGVLARDTQSLQVTPMQMAIAYAALFNGGALLKPNYDGVRKVRAQLRIDDKERSMLLDGMRAEVSTGTAEKAALDSLPVYIIGKTGTSTQLGGPRTQGWFVGIAFKPDAPPEPEDAQLVVVVYLKNAHGADAARLARPIFELK